MNITKSQGRVKVVVATTVMLSFISFWRAAAIVLNDLGSSAFYVGGITEKAVGKSAPWLILGVMLLSAAVSALYIESSTMFTRAQSVDLESELSEAIARIDAGEFVPSPGEFTCADCPALDLVCAGPGLRGGWSASREAVAATLG